MKSQDIINSLTNQISSQKVEAQIALDAARARALDLEDELRDEKEALLKSVADLQAAEDKLFGVSKELLDSRNSQSEAERKQAELQKQLDEIENECSHLQAEKKVQESLAKQAKLDAESNLSQVQIAARELARQAADEATKALDDLKSRIAELEAALEKSQQELKKTQEAAAVSVACLLFFMLKIY